MFGFFCGISEFFLCVFDDFSWKLLRSPSWETLTYREYYSMFGCEAVQVIYLTVGIIFQKTRICIFYSVSIQVSGCKTCVRCTQGEA
jgi:hypothetical protein